MSEGNKPEKKIRAGAIVATIWKNTGKTKDGKDYEFRTVDIQRGYKDKDDNWQNTSTMRKNDLPQAILVLTKAYEELCLGKEEEKEGE